MTKTEELLQNIEILKEEGIFFYKGELYRSLGENNAKSLPYSISGFAYDVMAARGTDLIMKDGKLYDDIGLGCYYQNDLWDIALEYCENNGLDGEKNFYDTYNFMLYWEIRLDLL